MRRCLASVFLTATMSFTACYQPLPSISPRTQAKKLYTRDEFKKLVIGKTKPDILEAVGKPVKTSDDPSYVFWMYWSITFDPVAEKEDGGIFIKFVDGKAVKVDF